MIVKSLHVRGTTFIAAISVDSSTASIWPLLLFEGVFVLAEAAGAGFFAAAVGFFAGVVLQPAQQKSAASRNELADNRRVLMIRFSLCAWCPKAPGATSLFRTLS